MYRKVIDVKEVKDLTIQLPEEFLHEEVEVVAFKRNRSATSLAEKKKLAAEAVEYFNSISVDMSHFKFDRDEANER